MNTHTGAGESWFVRLTSGPGPSDDQSAIGLGRLAPSPRLTPLSRWPAPSQIQTGADSRRPWMVNIRDRQITINNCYHCLGSDMLDVAVSNDSVLY